MTSSARSTVQIIAVLILIGAVAQGQASSCPVKVSPVKSVTRITPGISSHKSSTPSRKVSFKVLNISQRDIRSVSIRVEALMQVPGPAGPSFIDTARNFAVDAQIPPRKSKKSSIEIVATTGAGLRIRVAEVEFADGERWKNDGGLPCGT